MHDEYGVSTCCMNCPVFIGARCEAYSVVANINRDISASAEVVSRNGIALFGVKLFHSVKKFSLSQNQYAPFGGSAPLDNMIGRLRRNNFSIDDVAWSLARGCGTGYCDRCCA